MPLTPVQTILSTLTLEGRDAHDRLTLVSYVFGGRRKVRTYEVTRGGAWVSTVLVLNDFHGDLEERGHVLDEEAAQDEREARMLHARMAQLWELHR